MIVSSAGPSYVGEKKREAMHRHCTNTDLDKNYVRFHKETERLISKLLHTEADSFVMLGEALLSLEAACASLIEAGDRVLVIHNGFFGYCFKDFVEMYGGTAVMLEMDYRRGLDADQLEEYLRRDSDFKMATLVHCETPSGISNPIDKICPLLHWYGILSVVDSVSGIGGEFIDFDRWQIDVLLGGSQKCFSLPSGLATVTISERAKRCIDSRKTKIPAFYANLKNHYDQIATDGFLYTMNDSLMYGLRTALEEKLSTDYHETHKRYAQAVRNTLIACGYELYPLDSFSNTVTTIVLPEGVSDDQVLDLMYECGVIISGGLGHLKGKCIRIGHMGDNNTREQMIRTFEALDAVMEKLGVCGEKRLSEEFVRQEGIE